MLSPSPVTGPTGRTAWCQLLFATAFASAAALGRATIIDDQSLALVWPAGGVALLWWVWARSRAALVPMVALLATVTAAVNIVTGAAVEVGVVFAAVNVAQAAVGGHLVRRLLAGVPIGSLRGATLLLATALAAAAVGALGMGLGLGLVQGSGAVDPMLFAQWWGRNLTGFVVVAGLGLLVVEQLRAQEAGLRASSPWSTPSHTAEAVALLLVTTACFVLVFASNGRAFVPLLALTIWAGLRFAPLAVMAYTAACGACSVALTLAGTGPFAAVPDLRERAVDIQLFVLSLAVLGLVLSGSLADQRRLVARAEQAERVATARADLHAAVIEAMEEGVVVLDAAGRIVSTNAAAARLIAELPGVVRRNGDVVVLHPDGLPVAADETPVAQAMRDGHSAARDLVVHRSGEHRPVVLSVSATRLDDLGHLGTGAGAVLLHRDVTEDRGHRAELAAFAGVVAHDLRGPLSSVRGWLELSLSELQGPPRAAGAGAGVGADVGPLLARALESATRMNELIEALLLHASSADTPLRLVEVGLGPLVDEVAALYDVEDLVKAGDLPALLVDEVLVRQLFANLVGNAVKYVGDGVRPQVAIEAHVAAGEAEVWVTDNGIGIPAAERIEVFRPFHRAHRERGDIAGNGLGLALCRTIVERHGGGIAVQPAPSGTGSRFVLTLPIADSVVATPVVGSSPGHAGGTRVDERLECHR